MTRVSTYHQSQVLLQDVLSNQSRAFKADKQVSTGRVAETYKDIYRDIPSLTGAKSLLARLEQYEKNTGVITTTLAGYDQALGGLENAAGNLLDAVMGAVSSSSSLGFQAAIEGIFDQAKGFLNIQTNEGYLFGGSKKETPPVNIDLASDLLAAAEPPTDIFDNNSRKTSIRLDESRTLETGIVADEIGLELMTALQRIVMWQNGVLPTTAPVPTGPAGPMTNPLRDEDQAFLIGEIANIERVMKELNEVRGANGLNQKTVAETVDNLAGQVVEAKTFISSIEDVDAAEAISNLNQMNFALEASYNVLSRVNSLSLMNFLPLG
jgi:flagellar hook-associated protein 3 FlgL